MEVSQTWPLNCPWGEDDPILRDIYYKVSKRLRVYCSIYHGTKRGFLVLIHSFYKGVEEFDGQSKQTATTLPQI